MKLVTLLREVVDMISGHFFDWVITLAVVYGLFRITGPKKSGKRTAKSGKAKRRRLRPVHPLVAHERRLEAELKAVRTQIRELSRTSDSTAL